MLTKNDLGEIGSLIKTQVDEAVAQICNMIVETTASKEDLKRFATKEDLKRFATKEDLLNVEASLRRDIRELKANIPLKQGKELRLYA